MITTKEKEDKRVLLGMSGGTDSSVAAMLLQENGYEVIGVTFRFYEHQDDKSYLDEAQALANQLGIQHFVYDARQEFREAIINYFLDEYVAGRTPVPCMICNVQLKWPLLARLADEMGIFWISTGHYVNKKNFENFSFIAPATDADKDQSFFLWGLNQEILNRMLLPMGEVTKQEARAYATARGFNRVANKKDSLGVCFCPMDYRSFLRREVPANIFPGKGKFINEEGDFLGWHEGYPFYTIGQRRGLGLQLNHPIFVKEIIPTRNEVILAPLSSLYKMDFWLKEWNLVNPSMVVDTPESIIVKIRYRKQANTCHVKLSGKLLHVLLEEPLESIAPGQAAAFYNTDGLLLGGGIICSQSESEE